MHPSIVRLFEEASEELGRLDALASVAPAAVTTAMQTAVIARLATHASDDSQATRAASTSLVAARVDAIHVLALDPGADRWRELVEDGERRARSGGVLSPKTQLPDGDVRSAALDALRPGSVPRPLLWRALQVVAWLPDAADADLLSALLLVAGGLADRVRLLPFAPLRGETRADATAAWRAGDETPLARAGLSALAAEARHLRVQLRLLLDAQADEDEHLARVGRAAVTGRRVLAVLRDALATSVPDLSERLALSRPAAGAALERLVELGLAEEVTGRARDRVFVYAAAWGLV
jgi:hypothetical protein